MPESQAYLCVSNRKDITLLGDVLGDLLLWEQEDESSHCGNREASLQNFLRE